MIEPGIGRIVHYRPHLADPAEQPQAAIVIFVHDARSVNLACFSPEGTYYHRTEVPLLQDDDAAPAEGGHAEWMAFQKGQAAKTETTEGALAQRVAELQQVLAPGGPVHQIVDALQGRIVALEARLQAPGTGAAGNPAPAAQPGTAAEASQASAANPPAAPASAPPSETQPAPSAPAAAAQAAQPQPALSGAGAAPGGQA